MRRTLAAAAALILALPGAALADQDGHGRGHRHRAENQEHGRGHNVGAPGHFERLQIAEDRDRREERRDERRDAQRRNAERREERRDEHERHFTFRGQEYAAVRAPAYRYPRGYAYRAWHRGDVLPRLFIAAPYFLDYAYLGLPPPPPGTRWVRYGPDALLIDLYDDHVVDVIYNAFY